MENDPLNVKQAIAFAKTELQRIFDDEENIYYIRLEEVSYIEETEAWLITLSYINNISLSVEDEPRKYKIVTINKDKVVTAIKDRKFD